MLSIVYPWVYLVILGFYQNLETCLQCLEKPVWAGLSNNDNLFYLEDSYLECEEATLLAGRLFISLGFKIHAEKSVVFPTQVLELLDSHGKRGWANTAIMPKLFSTRQVYVVRNA